MRLFQLPNGDWVNLDNVCSVVATTELQGLMGTYYYCRVHTVDGKFWMMNGRSREEAEQLRDKLVADMMEPPLDENYYRKLLDKAELEAEKVSRPLTPEDIHLLGGI